MSLTAPPRPGDRAGVGDAGSAGETSPDLGLAPIPRPSRGAGLVATALAAALACEPAPKPDCAAACGPGTSCVDGQCVADAPVATPTAEPAKRKKRKKKKRVRRTTSGSPPPAARTEPEVEADADADTPGEPLPPFVPVDDRKIPQFSSDQTQEIDLNAGNERPSEADLDRHFGKVTPKITDCVITASRYGDVGSGRLAVKLRIAPSGKVESVSVKAPPSLAVWGIVPCARKAVYEHRFPAFDGPSVGVDFAVDVD